MQNVFCWPGLVNTLNIDTVILVDGGTDSTLANGKIIDLLTQLI